MYLDAQLYCIRQEHLPTSPTNPNFILHSAFTSTDQGEKFFLYDSNTIPVPYASAPTEGGHLRGPPRSEIDLGFL
jgi:hypothetical protein